VALAKTMKSLLRIDDLLMTPVIEDWLRRVPEGVIWDDEGLRLWQDLVTKADRNSQRAGRFGASSRGTCHRRQVFVYLGMPGTRLIDPETQNLFNDGKWRHLRWQMMGLQSGILTHAEYPATLPQYRVKVAMDGLNANDSWLFELKGDRRSSRLMDGDPDDHLLQIHTMFLVTGWDVASYVVEDKASNTWRERIVRRDPVIIRRVKDELEELNEHVERRNLPDVLPACLSKEGPYRSCAFGPRCLERHYQDGNTWPDVAGDWES
jgi:hypothetical protein